MKYDSDEPFDDFITMRCGEVIDDNEECSQINSIIAEAENNLKASLSKNQIKLFLQYEKLITNLQTKVEILIYKQGLNDRIAKK
jgi:hypothetical protein